MGLSEVRFQGVAVGRVIAWGRNADGQTNVPPAAETGVISVSAGSSHTVALKSNGSVIAWGRNVEGQTTLPPAAASGVTAIAAGGGFTIVLKSDGSVLAWGLNNQGQTTVPPAAASGVMAIAAGQDHTLALKSDGSVIAWGRNIEGQTTAPTGAASGVIAIAAGAFHSLALKSDGSVLAWGWGAAGQTAPPPAASSGVTAIAAGANHSVALKSGGVIAWGGNTSGQTTVPLGAASGVIAISAEGSHTLALKSDGSVIAWGGNLDGQTTVPSSAASRIFAIDAGASHSAALAPANLAPVITTFGATHALSFPENSAVPVLDLDATDEDTPAQTLTWSLSGADAAFFSINSSGILSFTAVPDFETRSSYAVTAIVTDSASFAASDSVALTITVSNVNEMPSFTKGVNQILPADITTIRSMANWATAINDGDSTVTQATSFAATNTNSGLFTTQPAISSTGTLTYTLNGTTGTATVSVTLTDDASIGSTAALTTAAQTFTITVVPALIGNAITTASVITSSMWDIAGLGGNKEKMINGDGLTGSGSVLTQVHDNNVNVNSWHAGGLSGGISGGITGGPPSVSSQAVEFDLGVNYDLSGAYIWNFNAAGFTGRGVKDVQILVSSGASGGFTALTTTQFSEATGNASLAAQVVPLIGANNVRRVRFNIQTAWSGAVNEYVGLSEVRFQGTALAAPPTVTTATSSAINFTVATLGGNVTSNGNLTLSERGVVYALTSANNDPLISGSGVTKVVASGTSTGTFTVNLTGLTPGSGYSFKAYATNSLGTSYTSTATFSTPVLPVEINVVPTTTQNFDVQRVGVASIPRVIKIENLGNAALTVSSVSATGGNASDFTVDTTGMLNSVPALGSTTFTLSFNPTASGARSSTLRILSNDADEGTTDIALSGTGTNVDPPVLAAVPFSTTLLGTSVTLGGEVTSEGGKVLTERGILIALTSVISDPYLGAVGVTKWAASGTTTGVFSVPVTGLTSGGAYTFRAFATNEGGTSYSDAVNFSTPSNNADLSALTVSTGTLSSSFNKDLLAYTMSVANSVTSFTVTPTRASSVATIEARVGVNGYAPATSGSPTAPFTLVVGANSVQVRVNAQDGSTKTYAITVTRAPSTNANLSALAISSGTLFSGFSASTPNYTVNVANTVTTFSVTPTLAETLATVAVNSSPVISGQASGSIDLNIGANPITVRVTAEDGTTVRNYVVTVTRADFPNTVPSFVIPTGSGAGLGAVWTPRLNDASRSWSHTATSTDGLRIVACEGTPTGSIWTSADAGVTWSERTFAGQGDWNLLCSSADGTKLSACTYGGKIWISADSGVTWTERTAAPAGESGGTNISCDSTGMKLFATNYGASGFHYTSTNQGLTWTRRAAVVGHSYGSASSADGNKLIAYIVDDNLLQVSSNFGTTWAAIPFNNPGLRDLVMSADGNRIFVAVDDGSTGQVHLSTNGGTSFIKVGPDIGIASVSCSSDGLRAALAANDGSVHTSTDGGTTWAKTASSPGSNTRFLRMSGNGTRLVCRANGFLHTSSATASAAQTAQAGDPVQTVSSFVSSISPGTRASESTQTVSFNVTNTDNALFSVQPAIAANGTLTYTPAASGSGSATVTIIAQDSGGTANGGVNSSASQTFTITLTPGTNLNLASLTISSGTLTPTFSATVDEYAVTVAATVATVTLTPTLADTAMKLSVNGSVLASGATSPALPLAFGPNMLVVTISNATGLRTKAYSVVVTRTPVVPTVNQPQFSVVVATAANLSGTVAADGGSVITERGIVYALISANANPEIGGTSVTKVNAATNGTGSFTVSVTALSENSDYSFKAYAINSAGTSYSSVSTFKTPVVTRPEIVTSQPKASPLAGGDTLVLTGRYFTGATGVTIGGVAATSIAVINDTSMTCVIPAGTAGVKDIVVTTGIGSTTVRTAIRYVDLTVTTAAETGPGSLREALRNAADMAGLNTITFSPALATQTISLSPITLEGTGNDNGYVIDDIGGVIIEGNGVTFTRTNASRNCRVFYLRSGALTLRGLTIQGAGGDLPGGAILNSGTLTVERCTLNNNTSQTNNGGAIYNDNGTVTLVQSTLASNRASRGGAILNDGVLTVRHCTIAGNSAAFGGGGIRLAQAMTLENSIVAGNSATVGFDIYNDTAAFTRVGASIVPDVSSSPNVNGAGTLLTANPQLTGLAANGGLTRTMLIQSGSPASNASVGSSITTDQRGLAITGTPDIGAVDVPPSAPVLGLAKFVSTTGTSASVEGVVTSTGGAALSARGFVYALTSANATPVLGGSGVTNVPISSAFSTTFTGLTAGSAYSFRAYATNSVGTTYSGVVTFNVLSNVADLSALVINSGTLAPAFAAATTSYTASVPAGTSSITLTLATPQGKGSFKVNGGAAVTMPLTVGSNTVTIVVTAENGSTTKTYSLTVTRPAAPPTLGVARTNVAFNQRTITGSNVVSEAALTAQGAVFALSSTNNNPQVGGFGVTNVPGTFDAGAKSITAAAITGMAPGSSYTFAVYATNSAGTGYSSFGVITIPNTNANLSALALSSGTLAPAFSASQLTYTASSAAVFMSVSPTAAVTGSVLQVNGAVVGSGSPSRDIPLVAGINTITIAVTAPDGSTQQSYTVAVSRAANPPILAPAVTKSAVLATTATLGGSITEDNGGSITERGIVYALTSANSNPSIGGTGAGTKVAGSGTAIGAFTVPVTGLATSSAYTFKAYATNSAGIGYSSTGTFSTGNGQPNTPPTFDMPGSGVSPAGANWAQLNNVDGNIQPIAFDASDDGLQLAVVSKFNTLHFSSNGGTAWRAGPGAPFINDTFSSVAISNSGQQMFIGADSSGFTGGAKIYGSGNAGAGLGLGYLASGSSSSRFACSDDGKIVFAVTADGVLVVSRDFGKKNTWGGVIAPGSLVNARIACSGDGLKGVIGTTTELFTFTTAADGKTMPLTKRNGAGPQNWSSLAMSKDGSVILGATNGGGLWVSTDGGVEKWTPYRNTPGRSWRAAACSTDGKVMAAAENGGKVWLYTDASKDFTEQSTSATGAWTELRMSSDGLILYGVRDQLLWKSVGGPTPYTLTVNPGSGLFTQSAFCKTISPGVNEANQTVSFNVTTTNNALFRKLPAISSDGTLTFAPGITAGDVTVTVTAQDDGGGTDSSAPRTFVIKLRSDDTIGTWASSAWTGDSTSGIVADRTLWAYDFGSRTASNANSVFIEGVPTSTFSNANLDLTGPHSVLAGDANNLTSPLARNFVWGGNPTELRLKGLSVGQAYVLSLLTVGWDGDAVGQRLLHFGSGSNALQVDPSFLGANNGTRVSYTFTADAAERVIRIAQANDTNGSFHLYGAALTVSGGATNQAPTNLALDNATMPEGNALGEVVGLLVSTDADTQQQHNYVLVDGEGSADNSLFAIRGKALVIAVTADRETKSSYTVRVRSTDNGFPKMSFTKALTVTISDVPEPAQDIVLEPSAFDENTPPGTLLTTTFRAIGDPDEPTVNFSLPILAGFDNDFFSTVVGTDGKTRLQTGFFTNADFETKSFYQLRVRGSDRNGGGVFEKDLRLTVNNLFESPKLTGLGNSSINEDSRLTLPFTLSDPDSAVDTITLSASSSNPALLPSANVQITGTGASRTLTATPLPNASGTAKITVSATDGATTPSVTFDLSVLAVNDAPSFNLPASIALSPNASRLGLANYVTDLNAGPLESSQTLTVSVAYPATSLLFDSNNAPYYRDGVLYAIPKASEFGVVILTVTLTDSGGTERGGIKSFSRTTQVTYQSNTSPQNLALTGNTLAENSPSGTAVGILSATDPENHALTFSLSGTGNDNAGFEIDNATKTLKTKAGLVANFEAKSTLTVTVKVTDNGTPAASIEKTFNIALTDANDAPTGLAASPASVTMLENLGPDVAVPFTFVVTDPDASQTHTFEIVPGSTDSSFFKFVNGKLQTNANFDFETKKVLSLSVRAKDNGSPPQTLDKTFTVNVRDVNERPTDILLLTKDGTAASTVIEEGVFIEEPSRWYELPSTARRPGTFWWVDSNLQNQDSWYAPFGMIALLGAVNPELGQTFRYEIVPDPATDGDQFVIFQARASTGDRKQGALTDRYYLRRAQTSVFDSECLIKKTYTVKVRVADNGLYGYPGSGVSYYRDRPESFPASYTKTLNFTLAPADEDIQFGAPWVAQNQGDKLVTIRYPLYDPESANCTIAMQWSADDGVTWNTPVSVTGALGTVPGNVRSGQRKQPTNDRAFTAEDWRTIVWNAGQDWNNQYTTKLRVRLTLNGTQAAFISPHLDSSRQITPLNTQGDGPMTIFGYVYNKLTGLPYIPLPGTAKITVTRGSRSVEVGANANPARFELTNCAPGRLSVSNPLFVVYEMDIPAPTSGYSTFLGDVNLTPDTDPPVVHKITMTQAGGRLFGAQDRGIALGGFGVQSKASIDMNWGKARKSGVYSQGDELRVYLNANPNATTQQLLSGATAFQSVALYRGINFETNLIDYDTLFKAGTQEGLNNIMVIAKNELGQWSDKPEVKPIYMLPLPGIIEKLSPLPGTGGRRAFSTDQLGFNFGTFDLKKVVDYPLIGKWGVEFSTSGSFDYTMSDGNWELAYRGGDLKLFGNQFLNRKINARPGYKSPYNDEKKEEDEPFKVTDLFLPKDNFKVVDGFVYLTSLFSEGDNKPRIALYIGDTEIEAAFFAAANGGVSATTGFNLPKIEGALIIKRTGPVAEFPLASVLGIPPRVAKYISPEVSLTAAVDLGGSATLAPVIVPTLNVPVYKPESATVTGGIDLKVAIGIDVDVAGIEAYVGGALKGRVGYPAPLLRQLNGRIYAGYEWYVLFASGGGELTLAEFEYQNADDPDLKKKSGGAAVAPAMFFAAASTAAAPASNQLNLTLPGLHVESQHVRPAGPMRRAWREHGLEHFNLLPVAAPSTQAQAKSAQMAKAGFAVAALPTPRSGVSSELDVFNRLGKKVEPQEPRTQAITSSDLRILAIPSDPLPAGAELPLLTNIFPRSRQALAVSNGNIMLVYPRDTGAANPVHFTEIAYTYYNGSSWTVPGSIAADPRAQTNPQIKMDGTGSFVTTWVRLKDLAFQGVGDLEAQAAQMEVVSSTFNMNTGTWSPAVALTDNDVLDHKTTLAGPLSDGDLLLTWTRNPGNQMNATATAPDTIMHARWDAATQSWGPASPVASGLVDVTSHAFDASGDRAVYVFTSEGDLHSINWTGGVWSTPVNETGDGAPDKTARVIVQPSGTVFTMWNHDGNLVMDRDASGTPTLVRGGADSGGFTDYALASSSVNGDLILLFSNDIDGQPDAFYRIYDASTQTWSSESRLSNDADLEAALVPVWDPQGNLIIAYHNTQLLTTTKTVTLNDGTEATVEGAIQPGRTDLLLARRLLTTDLNVRNVAANGSTFAPGSAVTLTGDLINSGNLPITGATISFYDGNPQTGGTLITTQTAPGFLYGADTFQASYEWTLPNDNVQHRLFIVADAANTVTEFDETNNATSRLIGGADLQLEYLSGSISADGSARIGVRVTNIGSPASTPCAVELWRSPVRGATPLFRTALSALDPAVAQEVALELGAGALSVGDNAFEIVVNEANLESEPNQGNNGTVTTLTLTAPPSPITGLSDLAISDATLSPSFLTGTTAYITSVPFDQTSVTVVPTVLHFGSTITVNGAPVPSGNASEALTLNSGSTQIVIEVTSQNGANKMSYTVAVHRGVGNADDSGNGSLRALLSIAALRGGPDVIALGREMDGQTIRLSSPIVINDPNGVVIDGSALENGVTIEGSGNHRLFEVAANSSLTLICVTLKDGGGTSFTSNGGAIQNAGTLRVERCTLLDNQAASGGAIHSTGTATILQSTFAQNTGGAIFNEGSASVIFSTLSRNVGTTVRSSGTLSIENSIIALNTGNDLDTTGATALTYRGANIVLTRIGIAATGPAPLLGSPLLSDLGRFGGPTQTFVPGVGSPAIDQAVATNSMSTVDQRGYARTQGSQPDIGSTEGRVLIVTTALDESDPFGVAGAGYSLREAVRDAEAGATVLFDRAVFSGSNVITLTQGPLNPARRISLVGTGNPGGITVLANLSIITQPTPQSVAIGGSATFIVKPLAVNGGISYQWRRDGVVIDGAVGSTYRVTNATEGDQAVYDVVLNEAEAAGSITLIDVSFAFGQVTSQRVSLTVGTPQIKVIGSPAHAILPLGAAHTLSAQVVGPALPVMTYQWYKDGAALAGAKSANLTLLNLALTNAGAYSCEAKSGTNTVTTEAAQIAVVDTKPKIVNLLAGGTFTPVLDFKGNELTFAWKRDAQDLGISATTFTLKPLSIANTGLYTCVVTGPGGTLANGYNTTLNVSRTPPALGAVSLPDALIGQSYYYKLPVLPIAGAVATGFSVTGALPAGILLNTTTGVLSGRPTVTKTGGYALSFTATNGATLKSLPRTAILTVISINPSAIGVFAGPMPRSPLNNNLGGSFDLTTNSMGTFSGNVTLGARVTIRFASMLLQVGGAGDQILTGNITGITMADTAKTPLAALVEIFVADQTARLTLTHPNGTQLVIPAWRNPWSKTSMATAYATNYTLRLDPGQGGEISPDGYGFASFSINNDGIVKLAGKLPDGNAITAGGFVGARGQVLVFQTLYKNAGSLVGQFDITRAVPVTTNSLAGPLTWSKPRVTTDLLYKGGFAPLSLKVEGSAYVRPNAGQRLLGLPAASDNALLDFRLGGLSGAGWSQPITIANPSPTGLTNTASLPTTAANGLKVAKLDAATGTFSGSFTLAGATALLNRPATFEGMIVNVGAVTQGYGFFLLPKVPVGTEKATTAPRLSGVVELGAP